MGENSRTLLELTNAVTEVMYGLGINDICPRDSYIHGKRVLSRPEFDLSIKDDLIISWENRYLTVRYAPEFYHFTWLGSLRPERAQTKVEWKMDSLRPEEIREAIHQTRMSLFKSFKKAADERIKIIQDLSTFLNDQKRFKKAGVDDFTLLKENGYEGGTSGFTKNKWGHIREEFLPNIAREKLTLRIIAINKTLTKEETGDLSYDGIDKVRRKAYKKVEEINSRAIIEIKQALVLMKILTVSPMVNRGAQS